MVVLSAIKWRKAHISTSQCSKRYSISFEYGQKMPGSDVQMDMSVFSSLQNEHYLHVCWCAHECLCEHGVLSGHPVAAGELIAFPFVFVQVFGDYYHFRHHAVEKRALSGHRGMHIRLQKEPQVRLVSALTQLIAALPCWQQKAKRQIGLRTESVYITREKDASINDSLSNSAFFSVHTGPSICPHDPIWGTRIAVNIQNKPCQTTHQLGVSLCLALHFLQSCKIIICT